jgi:hypothetical protein
VVARRPSRRAEQGLGSMGALLVAGYLGVVPSSVVDS